jgi:hypothetical protein
MKSLLFGNSRDNLPTIARHAWAWTRTLVSYSGDATFLVSAPGTFSNLWFKTSLPAGVGAGWTFTIRKNLVNTSLACAISGDTQQSAQDAVNSVTITQADIDAGNNAIGLRIDVAGVPVTTATAAWGLQFEGTSAKQSIMGRGGATLSTTLTQYLDLNNNALYDSAYEINTQLIMPCAGTFKNLCGKLSVAPGTGATRTLTVRKNGVDTAVTMTFSDTEVYKTSGATSVAVSAGDLISIQSTMSVSPAPVAGSFWGGITFEADTDGDFILPLGGVYTAPSPTVTSYAPVYASVVTWDTTSFVPAQQVAAQAFTAKAMYAILSGVPNGNYDLILYKNGLPTNLKVNIADPATTGNYAENVAIAAGDLLNYTAVPYDTPSGRGVAMSVCGTMITASGLKQMGGML